MTVKRTRRPPRNPGDLRWVVRDWANRIGVQMPHITLRQMTTRWASISTAGHLTLNTDLIELPADLIEFVIVHELVHLLASNHGRVFKSFMFVYLPDWEVRAEKLRRYRNGAKTHVHSRGR